MRAHNVPVTEILGRDDELVVIDEFLGPTAPLPAALVIEGETGIGKTTLWRHAVSLARDRSSRVLTSSPSEAEMSLSFSAIADLLDDDVDRAWSALPPPQARALEVALRRSDPAGQPPDQYAIRAAFLGVLRALAQEGPVVVAADDVQWLDAPSALVLEFAARRLKRDAVTFVVARRDGDGPPPIGLDRGGPELRVVPLRVGPLSLGAIHRLLNERLGTSIRRPVLRKIYDTSGGNPFFAVELANELARHGLELLADEPLPLPRSLQQLVRSRLSRLAPSTSEVLLAVSSLSQPTTGLLDSAFGADQVASALEEATGAGIVEVDRRQVRFAHPLLASACYGEASAEERKAVHRLAAGLVEDSEERAHHLALATDDEDDEVASELERAAVHASDRGAPEAAAELADLATARTAAERRSELVERTLQAGDYRLRSGDAHGARVRFQLALERASSGHQRSAALLRLAQITNDLDEAVDLGLRGLDDTADPALTCRLHQQLAGVYLARGLAREALVHARRSLEAAEQLGDESLLAGALTCASELEYISAGNAKQAVVLLQRALALERRPFAPLLWNPQFSLARWHVYEGRGEEATAGLTALLDGADDRGDDWARVLLLQELSRVDSNAGRLETADCRLTEAIELAQLAGFGHRTLLVAKAYLDAQLGLVVEARSLASESLELGIAGKSEHVRLDSLAVLGFLELSLGELSAANARLRTLPAEWLACGTRFPSTFGAWANTIEVLITVGSRDQAREYLAQYDELAAGYSVPWQLATAARCHGLLAMVDGRSSSAFEWFERALSEHAQAPSRFEEARTLLAYGAALRRAKRRRQGRERLEQALATFEELGTPLWAKKARTEMSRLGGRGPGSGKLTPGELQIAELVAAGRSNKEVAAALFLTPKTVETKLSRMYAKLGIHSRGELANRMLSGGKV